LPVRAEAGLLDHRTGYRIRPDDLALCFCIGFSQKPHSTFRADALAGVTPAQMKNRPEIRAVNQNAVVPDIVMSDW